MSHLTLDRFTQEQKISLAFIAAAILVGILTLAFWNQLGEAIGPIFGYLTCGLLVMAVLHNWTDPRRLLILAAAAVLAFIVFAVLHNVFYGIAELTSRYAIVSGLFSVLEVSSFLIAVLLAPATAAVALVGAVVNWLRPR